MRTQAIGILCGCAAALAAPEPKGGGLAIPDNLFAPAPAAVAPTSVVAVVEGRPILQADVDRVVERALAIQQGRIPAGQMNVVRQQLALRAREEMITQAVLVAEAERQKIQVTEEEVRKAREALPLPPGQTLDSVLAAQGMTAAQLDEDLRRALRIRALLDKNVQVAEPTDAEVKAFYEQNYGNFNLPESVTARHILIAVPSNATEAVRSEKRAAAEKVRAELQAGADFAELARKYSDDPGSRDRGGVYTFGRGQMVAPFEQAAFTQKIGEIGPLVETVYGFHIIQTTNRSPARTVGLEEAAPRIREFLSRNGRAQAEQEYVRKLRESAKVVLPAAAGP